MTIERFQASLKGGQQARVTPAVLQLTGALLVPFVVEMETLFLTALFRPLDEQLFISQLNVIQVRPESKSLTSWLIVSVQACHGPCCRELQG